MQKIQGSHRRYTFFVFKKPVPDNYLENWSKNGANPVTKGRSLRKKIFFEEFVNDHVCKQSEIKRRPYLKKNGKTLLIFVIKNSIKYFFGTKIISPLVPERLSFPKSRPVTRQRLCQPPFLRSEEVWTNYGACGQTMVSPYSPFSARAKSSYMRGESLRLAGFTKSVSDRRSFASCIKHLTYLAILYFFEKQRFVHSSLIFNYNINSQDKCRTLTES